MKKRRYSPLSSSDPERSGSFVAGRNHMVIFDVSEIGRSRDDFLTLMARAGVLFTPERESQVRAVMHLDVTLDDVKTAGNRTTEVL